MAKGTVKWFNPTKGYGFIQPSNGGKDVFVHISAVEKAGLSTLNEGQSVEYEEIANRGKTSAENLKVKRERAIGNGALSDVSGSWAKKILKNCERSAERASLLHVRQLTRAREPAAQSSVTHFWTVITSGGCR